MTTRYFTTGDPPARHYTDGECWCVPKWVEHNGFQALEHQGGLFVLQLVSCVGDHSATVPAHVCGTPPILEET